MNNNKKKNKERKKVNKLLHDTCVGLSLFPFKKPYMFHNIYIVLYNIGYLTQKGNIFNTPSKEQKYDPYLEKPFPHTEHT